jgi:hypothetical protein
VILGGAEGDDIEVGLGSDIVLGDGGEVNLNNVGAGAANDIRTIDGAIGGDDLIVGGAGVSVLIGGFGADRIVTGQGSATLIGDNGEILRDENAVVRLVRTTDLDDATAGADLIQSAAGSNIILGGLGAAADGTGDAIDAPRPTTSKARRWRWAARTASAAARTTSSSAATAATTSSSARAATPCWVTTARCAATARAPSCRCVPSTWMRARAGWTAS